MSHVLTELVFCTYICMFIHSLYKAAFVNVCGECTHTHTPIITDVILTLARQENKILSF